MDAILGISAFYHDSAAALVIDGEIVSAAHEERFTREKHDASFPAQAIVYCLEEAGLALQDIKAVIFYDKPLLKFERLLETYYAFAPRGLRQFLSSMPVWIREKLFLRKLIQDELKTIANNTFKLSDSSKIVNNIKLLFTEHHLSHAASAFFPSPFDEAAILTIDGVGEWATASICRGKGNQITILRELDFPHSVGLLYSAFTYYLGFKVNSGEYKMMGLAPYGRPESETTLRYEKLIKENLVQIYEDGSVWLNQEYFDYAVGLKMIKERKWEELFTLPRREPETELSQEYCDFALAAQRVTEEIVFKLARTARQVTGSKYLCLAGGVALNCVANGKLLRSGIFEDIWIQPAAGDAGGALGAALAGWHIWLNKERKSAQKDKMQGAYLGPEFDNKEIKKVMRKYGAVGHEYEDFEQLCRDVASLLDKGMVVGWFQGRMEWGPRALGNRSILGDARNTEMQKKLNLKIKFRENFRPFAPSVLAEKVDEYFEMKHESPYMLLVCNVKKELRRTLPEGYDNYTWRDKLYYVRSELPAITHIDFSARVQTVHKETNERYWQLIKAFEEQTGWGVIVNTSFNVRGEPIVCTPEDAYRCFMRTEMDYLVMGDVLFKKEEQPQWEEEKDWREEYELD